MDDFTEDKLEADAMRKANVELSLFRKLLDHSSDAIEVIDPLTLRFLDVNETACRDLGYSREELLSMTLYDIDPALNPDTIKMIEAQKQESGVARFETIRRRKDGSLFFVIESTSLWGAFILEKSWNRSG
jgi:PAS domain S-box-containing protein